jgi:hypothetical protein
MTTFDILKSLQPIGPLRELRPANDKTAATKIAFAWFVHSEAVDKLMKWQLQELTGLMFAWATSESVAHFISERFDNEEHASDDYDEEEEKSDEIESGNIHELVAKDRGSDGAQGSRGMALKSSTPMMLKAATAMGLKAVAVKLLATAMARLLG